jgi:hypothetical protein
VLCTVIWMLLLLSSVLCIHSPYCLLLFTSIYLWLYSPLLNLGHFFSLLMLYTVSRTSWMRDQPFTRPPPTHRTTHTQTTMPWVASEPTIPVFERAKTVHALDCAATVIGITDHIITLNCELKWCKLRSSKYSSLSWNQNLINQEVALRYTVNETVSIKDGILLWDERRSESGKW